MSTTGSLESKPLTLSEMRDFIGDISAHARGGNTLKATKTGAMVSVDDAYAGALLGLTVYGNSTQNGTPTPETPVPIKSIGYAIVNTNNNVNLCGGSAITSHWVDSSNFGEDEYGRYVVNTANNYTGRKIFIQGGFKPNTAYTLILKYRSTASSGTSNTTIYYTDGTKKSYTNGSPTEGAITLVVTTNPAKTVDRFCGFNSSGTAYIYYDECGLFEGVLTADDFVPYDGSSTVLNLIDDQGVAHELRSVPDGTRDELILNADGSGTLYEKARYRTFVGSESWGVSSARSSVFYATLEAALDYYQTSYGNLNYYLVSQYTKVNTTNANMQDGEIRIGNASATRHQPLVYVCMTDYDNDLDAFKAHLASNPIEVVWKTDDVRTYHIPAINMPSLPALESNVWVAARDKRSSYTKELSNNELAIEYRRDINKVIGDIEEAIADIVSQ